MKKNKLTRNSYKRKIILFAVFIFVSVALISTGFAAWVLSSNAEHEEGVGVSVGTITEANLKITVNENNDKFLFEPKADDTSGRVHYDGTNSENLSITITGKVEPMSVLGALTYRIKFNKSVVKAFELEYVKLKGIADPTTSEGSEFATTGEITITPNQDTGEFSITIEFEWGNAFKGKNPGNYYDEDPEGIAKNLSEAKETLENLRACFYGYYDDLQGKTGEVRDNIIKSKLTATAPEITVVISATAK